MSATGYSANGVIAKHIPQGPVDWARDIIVVAALRAVLSLNHFIVLWGSDRCPHRRAAGGTREHPASMKVHWDLFPGEQRPCARPGIDAATFNGRRPLALRSNP
jgi:hypothetical protein